MMARVQVALDRETYKRARKRAAEIGVSFAEYVRTLLARDLGEHATSADPAAIFDLGASGSSQIACDKDDAVGRAIAAERARKPYRGRRR